MNKHLVMGALALFGLAATESQALAAKVVNGKFHFSFVVPSLTFGFGGNCTDDCHPCHGGMPGMLPGPWYMYYPNQPAQPYWGQYYNTGPSVYSAYPPYYYHGQQQQAVPNQAAGHPQTPPPAHAAPQYPYHFTGGVPAYWQGR
jgi:hypothetical protein